MLPEDWAKRIREEIEHPKDEPQERKSREARFERLAGTMRDAVANPEKYPEQPTRSEAKLKPSEEPEDWYRRWEEKRDDRDEKLQDK